MICSFPDIRLVPSSSSMTINGALAEVDLAISLGGTPVTAHVLIENSFKTDICFSYFRQPYTFVVTKWAGRSQRGFFEKFHDHVARDPVKFGRVKDDGELDVNIQQKLAIICQAAEDICSMLDRILQTHSRGIVDYAIWYREHKPREDTYAQFIARVTCHCIIHSSFLDPKVQWTEVLFL